jgi:hypothetical protein
MSQTQINDIYDKLNAMAEEMAVIRAMSRLVLWLAGGAISGIFAVAMAVFVWWLGKQ